MTSASFSSAHVVAPVKPKSSEFVVRVSTMPSFTGPILALSLDLETTSRSVPCPTNFFTGCAVCEIGAVVALIREGGVGEEVGEFQAYCRPRESMEAGAEKVTGLTNEQLASYPPYPTVFKKFVDFWNNLKVQFVGVPTVLLTFRGHKFDVPVLLHDLRCCGADPAALFPQLSFDLSVDVQALLREKAQAAGVVLFIRSSTNPNLTLGEVYKSVFHRELQGAHGAVVDARAVVSIITGSPAIGKLFTSAVWHCFTSLRSTNRSGPDVAAEWAIPDLNAWCGKQLTAASNKKPRAVKSNPSRLLFANISKKRKRPSGEVAAKEHD